jgi:hypothetical protein
LNLQKAETVSEKDRSVCYEHKMVGTDEERFVEESNGLDGILIELPRLESFDNSDESRHDSNQQGMLACKSSRISGILQSTFLLYEGRICAIESP